MRTHGLDTLFIKTYGCQMNAYDSARMADLMRKACGLRLASCPEDADVILMNTCSVREKAEEKIYSELGRYRLLKEERPDLIIGVGGCVGQQEGERIQERAPFVDLVFGPQSYHKLPEMVKKIRRRRVRLACVEMPEIEKFDHLPEVKGHGPSAFVTVMEGCDKFCTFCVVPYTRGPEISRPVQDVLEECRSLLTQGAVEITLLGQNVNAYRGIGPDGSEWDFARLLHAVSSLDGLRRLRFTTSHPLEMHDDLIAAFADIPQLMPFLHLPVQSGSDRILKAMHRGHDRREYLDIVASLRKVRPDLALSTDIIVGFPGESEEDFEATLALVQEVGFDSAFCFKYSPRIGTPAAKMKDTLPDDVKNERLQHLLELTRAIAKQRLKAQVGRVVDILVDGRGKRKGDMQGRTPDYKIVHFRGDEGMLGRILPLRITHAYDQSLRGGLLSS